VVEINHNKMILIKSKLSQKILTYFFTNPEGNFYVRELARLLNEDVSNLAKELIKLEKEGIFESEIRGKTKYYHLNKNYPLYKQLKEIIFKTTGIEGGIKKELEKLKKINQAFLFGSFAIGEADSQSDIDLLIIGDPDPEQLSDKISKLEDRFSREINYIVMTEDEFRKKKNKEPFLIDIFKNETNKKTNKTIRLI